MQLKSEPKQLGSPITAWFAFPQVQKCHTQV
jgi:hypothetical protein